MLLPSSHLSKMMPSHCPAIYLPFISFAYLMVTGMFFLFILSVPAIFVPCLPSTEVKYGELQTYPYTKCNLHLAETTSFTSVFELKLFSTLMVITPYTVYTRKENSANILC
jgi:hypothetical protein